VREYKPLVPKTENSPAKIKDPGVINLVKTGQAAYNAKSGELLFLPEGEAELRSLTDRLFETLFVNCGFQRVRCGGDEEIFSLAERYVREWGEDATGFCEERGRAIRILSWNPDLISANAKADTAMKTITGGLGGVCAFVGDVTGAAHTFVLASKCEAGAIGSRPGYFCPSCGRIRFPDSPLGYVPKHPCDDEAEGTLEDVETPGANTIVELCGQLDIEVPRTLKAMLYVAMDSESKRRAVASFVRGDYNLSMTKLSKWLESERGLTALRSADKAELHELIGEVAGYCGPVGMPPHVVMVCDDSVKGSKNTVVGANRPGYHKKGCCHPRDFDPPIADIAQITNGTPCECGGTYEQCAIRESGKIEIARAEDMPEKNIKPLSYRDREGAHDYPAVCAGTISVESAMLALHS